MAERLKASGLKAGFVGAYVLDSKWGVDQGFDTYFDDFDLSKFQSLSLGSVDRPGNEVADRALEWLEDARSSRFFAWAHFFDAHSPYAPPEPYRSRYTERPFAGEIAFVDSQVGRLLAFLDSNDLAKKTVVAVMGDHGESLGEHGEATHGFFVYEIRRAGTVPDSGALRPYGGTPRPRPCPERGRSAHRSGSPGGSRG